MLTFLNRLACLAIVAFGLTFENSSAAQRSGPKVVTATYFGGSQFDRAQGVDVDADGNIYFIMNTYSSNLPTLGADGKKPFQAKKAGTKTGSFACDAYVAKLSADGKKLIWATYLGGRHHDRGYTLKVDAKGFVFCSSWTNSTDFPTTSGAFDETCNDDPSGKDQPGQMDIAITKLKPDGSDIVWSTFLGGRGGEQSRNALDVDAAGNVYVSGFTTSTDFPTTRNAFQSKYAGKTDAFVTKIAADGSKLLYSTYLGGSGQDSAISGVQVHGDGSIFVAGMTQSKDFPTTTKSIQKKYGGDKGKFKWMGDGFVVRLSMPDGKLMYSTYLGGSGADNVAFNDGLTVRPDGEAVVIVNTTSSDMPIPSGARPFQPRHQGGGKWPTDAYVARLSADGSEIVAATYFGGTGSEEVAGVDIDKAGNVHISGFTQSDNLPTTRNSYRSKISGPSDAWYCALSADLSSLKYSTYFGGGQKDRGRELIYDPTGHVVISGDTLSADFATTDRAVGSGYSGGNDAILIRIKLNELDSANTDRK